MRTLVLVSWLYLIINPFPSIGNLTSLSYLNFSYAGFAGQIPKEIFRLTKFSILDYSRNVGCLERFPKRSFRIDLSRNEQLGPISMSNFRLRDLEDLSLSFNKFNGMQELEPYPLHNLHTFDLSFNQLHGKIPILPPLTMNNSSSPIPDAFPIDCSLHILDLDGKLLTDRIPKLLANCRYLEVNDIRIDEFYYEDGVTAINKGIGMEMIKIARGFTSIGFSSNNFEVGIPKELELLKFLHDQQDWDQGKGEGKMTAYYLTYIRVSEVDIFYKIHDDRKIKKSSCGLGSHIV
ncbi:LRR receptor-like serine/threonine-protein kinase ERL2 [Ziziphus jujuba]|uniref:LRR receptor-like serine/threonine-protein kinase ERL2 n=1 Tax=Ziziphus jujuba TaxID=326968 RepID=A0ABM4A994_ZIZJJ|nr:LRR receptor-like serine/threonine-protein kinase ERL2 [Ziziphus jujuba]